MKSLAVHHAKRTRLSHTAASERNGSVKGKLMAQQCAHEEEAVARGTAMQVVPLLA